MMKKVILDISTGKKTEVSLTAEEIQEKEKAAAQFEAERLAEAEAEPNRPVLCNRIFDIAHFFVKQSVGRLPRI